MTSSKLVCPVCKNKVLLLNTSKISASFPFCSERCKLIDLGAWAKEEYKVQSENYSLDTDETEQD